MTIALSEEAAWRSFDTFWAYEEAERNRWSVREERRDVPAVDGVVHYWGDNRFSTSACALGLSCVWKRAPHRLRAGRIKSRYLVLSNG